MTAFPKPTRWQSKKYRDAARGQDCKLRLPGCRNETETVVLCHRNGAGMGTKASDHDAADACAYCHTILDGKTHPDEKLLSEYHRIMLQVIREDRHMEEIFDRARFATIINRIERGILK